MLTTITRTEQSMIQIRMIWSWGERLMTEAAMILSLPDPSAGGGSGRSSLFLGLQKAQTGSFRSNFEKQTGHHRGSFEAWRSSCNSSLQLRHLTFLPSKSERTRYFFPHLQITLNFVEVVLLIELPPSGQPPAWFHGSRT